MEVPEPRYAAASDGVSIAYQVLGRGRHDIVYLPGNATQLDVMWEHPVFAGFRRRLADLGRLIMVDRRGVGLSDRVAARDLPPVEVSVSDLVCVLDTVRSRDTVLFGCDEGAMTAVLTAAAHPERIRQLVLFGARPSMVATQQHPWGGDRQEWDEWLAWAADHWGSRDSIVHDMHETFPSQLNDESAIAFGAKVAEGSGEPTRGRRGVQHLDAAERRRRVAHGPDTNLGAASTGRRLRTPEAGRAVAGLIPDSMFVEVPGEDHFVESGPQDALFEHLRSFLRLEVTPVDRSRRLATTLFTDIVGSTERSAQLGDTAWKELLESHHGIVREELARTEGAEVDTAGDGFFATFEGPAAATMCAVAIARSVRSIGLEIRAGVHTGEVETIDGKVGGLAVTIGSRVSSLAGPSEVLVTSTVKDLVAGSGLAFQDAGEHPLKGVPEPWHLYRVVA